MLRLARWAAIALAGRLGDRLGMGSELPCDPSAMLEALFGRRIYPARWFSDELRDTLPPAKLAMIVEGLVAQFGPLQAVRSSPNNHVVELERGFVRVMFAMDLSGRLTRLHFSTASPRFDSLDEAAAAFRKLPGDLSLLVRRDDRPVCAIEPERVMAVGSAFKLAIMSVLARQVASGRLAWTELVPLKPDWHSLPSGVLQDWPDGLPLSVETLACLMISISDNTATTALLELVGRDQVEAVAPGCCPFLSPREFFILKSMQAKEQRRRYLATDIAGKRQVLSELRGMELPHNSEVLSFASHEIEWRFSAYQLCNLLREVAVLPALHINPGLADRQDWRSVAFKGGSDTGVLSLNTWLERADGVTWCISAIWNNDRPINSESLYRLYMALIDLLRRLP